MEVTRLHVEKIKELIEECSPYERKELLSFIMHTTAPPIKFETEDELSDGWEKRRREQEKRDGFVEPSSPNLPPSPEMKREWRERENEAFKRGIVDDKPNEKPTSSMVKGWEERRRRAEMR